MAVSVWTSRQSLFVNAELRAHPKVTIASVQAVIAGLAAKATGPLNKMDALRPNEKNSEALRVIEQCSAAIHSVISPLSPVISTSPIPQVGSLEESVNTHSFK